jgi:hypothetical protein
MLLIRKNGQSRKIWCTFNPIGHLDSSGHDIKLIFFPLNLAFLKSQVSKRPIIEKIPLTKPLENINFLLYVQSNKLCVFLVITSSKIPEKGT